MPGPARARRRTLTPGPGEAPHSQLGQRGANLWPGAQRSWGGGSASRIPVLRAAARASVGSAGESGSAPGLDSPPREARVGEGGALGPPPPPAPDPGAPRVEAGGAGGRSRSSSKSLRPAAQRTRGPRTLGAAAATRSSRRLYFCPLYRLPTRCLLGRPGSSGSGLKVPCCPEEPPAKAGPG